MNLRGEILTHPKFKETIMRIFTTVRDFTTFAERNGDKALRVVVPKLKKKAVPEMRLAIPEKAAVQELKDKYPDEKFMKLKEKMTEETTYSTDYPENYRAKFLLANNIVERN